MSETKTTIKYYTVMEYEEEGAYLTAMHRKGWKFVSVTPPFLYHFEKCEPSDVCYRLDYNQDGIAHPDEYRQMFADMGWEYLTDYVGYSYFRKPAANDDTDVDIFCDEDSRFEMVRRIFNGRIIPLIGIFCCLILPVLIRCIVSQGTDHATPVSLLILMSCVSCLYLFVFVTFIVKYVGSITNFVGFRIPLVIPTTHIE